MESPHWKLEDDLRTVTVTFSSDPVVEVHYDLAAVQDMIRGLGMIRSAMSPAVARDQGLGQKIEVIPDPRWATEPDVMAGDSILHIRDPRFGWLHYLLPRLEAKNLARLLQVQAESQPLRQPPEKMN